MIVKLTYSADLDEVPGEVAKIVNSVNGELQNLTKDLTLVSTNLENVEPDVKTALSKIQFAMKFVEKVNLKLKDCESILSGYLGVVEKKEETTTQKAKVEQSSQPSEVEKSSSKKKAG